MAKFRNIALFVVLVSIDQLSKYIIRTSGGFYICNEGMAFGIELPGILIISLVLVILFLWLFLNPNNKISIPNKFPNQNLEKNSLKRWDFIGYWSLRFGILLVTSGAISNIADRLFLGCVTDFIDLRFWPVFNFADIYITIGATLLIMKHITYNIKQKMD